MTNATSRGRSDLADWSRAQPESYYTSGRQLARILRDAWGDAGLEAKRAHLEAFGHVAAGPLDRAAIVNNRHWNLPRLDRWSPFGERTEAIEHHPSYDECGRHIYQDGRVIAAYGEPASNLYAQALFWLSSHAGEAGHNCPVACTAGVVKAVSALGSDELRAAYLPGLLTAEYPARLDGAQFLTELQGGSDVGANAVVATPDGEGLGTTRWRIRGEKWFCSNADADLILMTARFDRDVPGTRGLGLFLVPRVLPDGTLNHFAVRRLKDKLGTRSMPSGEMDFGDAVAFSVGPVERGFRTVMEQVITTSRLYNTVGCAGIARRARLVATTYAQHRRAFGQAIIDFPQVQEMLATMRAAEQAVTAGALALARGFDRAERGELADDPAARAFLRVGTNLAKLRSCQHSHRVVLTAIETLGGNGAIESFSVLPRLLRDNVVYENWEGTHNVLVAQTVRDFAKSGLHEGFLEVLGGQLRTGDAAIDHALEPARRVVEVARSVIDAVVKQPDAGVAALMLRPQAEALGDALFAAAYAADIATETDEAARSEDTETLVHFVDTWLASRSAGPPVRDAAYAARVESIAIAD